MRNIVEYIQFPLDGVEGFIHKNVKELKSISSSGRFEYIDNKNTYLVTMRTNKNLNLVELFGNKLSGHTKAVSGFIKNIHEFIK